ncbi:MAG: dihydrodipicolinate synthase family protein [Ferroplasma sp.]|uniref:dihydrodipicolinate synthase family protein n=1 Tax=Ferroplasma sp. TaxID=2591003 RepID=UPI00281632B5|nr:dihydrodipicolinate synthase family protein [Ferroplasma sp.]WMT50487.1 MAG: dihydrodipicolinate synthase family protein [Ferroplasma sp.]
MKQLESIIPLITPFTNNRVDKQLAVDHGNDVLKGGMKYLFLAGTTGVGPSLSTQEKLDLLDAFSNIPDSIMLQVGSLNLEDSVEMARAAKKKKIHAVAALPPYYFTGFKREWLVKYYVKISSEYPTIIYNYPDTTGYNITYDIINDIKKAGGNVIGIKETTFDMNDILNTKMYVDNFKVYTGPDQYILSGFRLNLDGYVSGAGNYGYKIIKGIEENYDNERGDRYQFLLNELSGLSRKYGTISSIYDMVEIITGVDAGCPREPFFKMSEGDRLQLKNEINTLMEKYNFKL